MQVGLPEKAGGNRTPGTPRFTETAGLGLVRPHAEPQMFANRELQAKITGGRNVWSAKREEQINCGTPAPNSSDGQQLGESRLIFSSGKPREIEYAAVDHPGEMAGISHLLTAKPARPKGCIVEREIGLRR